MNILSVLLSDTQPTRGLSSKFIDVLCGGRYYVSIGLDVVIWVHPDYTSSRIFDCYDDLIFFIKQNGVENV